MNTTKSKAKMRGSEFLVISKVETARSVAHNDIREKTPKQLAAYHRDAAARIVGELETELLDFDGAEDFSAREALKVVDLAERAAYRLLLIRSLVQEVSP